MSKFQRILQKRVAISSIIMFALGLALTAPTFAWGPDRATYTNESPADYATFNSIIDNVAVGDERNFVRVGEVGSSAPYTDTIEVEPGKEYEVYIYYHNNAGSNTNASGVGIATNTRVTSAYPTFLKAGEQGTVSGIITWSYVTPAEPNTPKQGEVWDEAFLTTKSDGVVLRYKTGSAVIHNSGEANGSVLSSNLFTNEGALIGFNQLGGNLPGCAEYSGHITYTLVAEQTNVNLEKKVSLDGENWSDNVTAKPGQYVTYKITFQNIGNTNLNNVIFKDTHDDGLSLKSGSTTVYDADHTDGLTIDDIIDISGYNTGTAVPTALRQIIYQARVSEDANYCGKILNNKILLSYDSADQGEDFASVTVDCDTPSEEDCKTNPNLPGCKNCATNPEMEGCQELPNTGPLEIVFAIIIIAGIGGGGYYLYRTRKTLNKVESVAKGDEPKADSSAKPDSDQAPKQ